MVYQQIHIFKMPKNSYYSLYKLIHNNYACKNILLYNELIKKYKIINYM